jgi:hypothetical protein
MLIDAERTEAAEKNVVPESASGEMWDCLVAEEITSQGSQTEPIARTTRIKESEGGNQCQPQIVAPMVGEISVF